MKIRKGVSGFEAGSRKRIRDAEGGGSRTSGAPRPFGKKRTAGGGHEGTFADLQNRENEAGVTGGRRKE